MIFITSVINFIRDFHIFSNSNIKYKECRGCKKDFKKEELSQDLLCYSCWFNGDLV